MMENTKTMRNIVSKSDWNTTSELGNEIALNNDKQGITVLITNSYIGVLTTKTQRKRFIFLNFLKGGDIEIKEINNATEAVKK